MMQMLRDFVDCTTDGNAEIILPNASRRRLREQLKTSIAQLNAERQRRVFVSSEREGGKHEAKLTLFDENVTNPRPSSASLVYFSSSSAISQKMSLKALQMKHISLQSANLRSSLDISQFLVQFYNFCRRGGLIEHSPEDLDLTLQTDKTGDPLT